MNIETVLKNSTANLIYICIAVMFQIGGMFFVHKLELKTVSLGSALFLAGTGIQLLEIYQPPLLLKWIMLWKNTLGRGVVMIFLSLVAMNGCLFAGIIALSFSLIVFLSPLISHTYATPTPIFDLLTNGIQEDKPVDAEGYGAVSGFDEIIDRSLIR